MGYRVLGEVDVVVDGELCSIGSPKQRLVLAALLAHPNAVVTTDALVAALWGDEPPSSAVPSLRTYVSRLRRLVGAALGSESSGYRLAVGPDEVDATRFERLVDDAATTDPVHALDLLDTALGMWGGPAFGDHAAVPLIVGAARRLEQRHVDALEARAVALLASGAPGKAVAEATAVLADHPHREGLWITLIDALVAARRHVEAARAASDARSALAAAGLEPGPELGHAESRALGLQAPGERARADDGGSESAAPDRRLLGGDDVRKVVRPSARPITRSGRPSSFVGRERQLDELVELLADAPVVTLVGPGGVGKTRLAVELAARVAPEHRLGARLIELGALVDPDDVAAAIASGLGLTVDHASIHEVLPTAGDLDLVAVIDNAEHVADAAARAVELLASAGGTIRIVVTSRQRLGVDGEHVRAVRPLAIDGPEATAATLLRERAAAAGAALQEVDDDIVIQVVQRLDGLPLAIEMAAAQLTSCSLVELLASLDLHLAELATPSTLVPPRHQSLGALIDWSIDRLGPGDATLLHQLTAFAGPFTAEDVAGVLGPASVPTTRRLADRSLLAAAASADRTTFRVLHVVRERVHQRVGPAPEALRAAHARWYLDRARSAVAVLMSPDERAGRDALNAVVDEMRSAHRWAVEHDPAVALALSAAVHPYAQSSLRDEVLSWADRVLDAVSRSAAGPSADRDDLAVALASSATRAAHRGDHEAGARLALEALAVAVAHEARLPALEALADARLAGGELGEADVAYRNLMDDAHTAGNVWYEASGAAGVLLVAAYGDGTPSRRIDPTEYEARAPLSGRAWLAYGQAELCADADPERARQLYHRALDLSRSVVNCFIEGVTLTSLASIQCRIDPADAALATFRAAIEHWLDSADRTHQLTALRNLAVLLRSLDLPLESAQLLGGLRAADVSTYGTDLENISSIDRWLSSALSPDELADALATGGRLDTAELARWALAVIDRLTS